MTTDLSDILDNLPAQRQAIIAALAKKKILENFASSSMISALRDALHIDLPHFLKADIESPH